MARWQKMKDAVKQAVGDVSDRDVQDWLLDRARFINAESKWLTAPITIGTTVANQSEYTLGDTFVDLAAVRVGTTVYDQVSPMEMWQLEAGTATVRNGGVFAADATAAGSPKIQLYPTPDAGLTIEGRQVLELSEPTSWATQDPPFPSDFDNTVVHGAIAIGLARVDEKLGEAEWHEQRFMNEIGRLIKRRNSRIGSGPTRVRVYGKDFW